MADDATEYLPERFRVSAGHHDEAAEVAAGLARMVGNVSPSASDFGGSRAASFSSALGNGADERARGARRADESRTGIADGALGAADLGDESESLADTALRAAALTDEGLRIADAL
jgi:hypothetical protein